MEEKLLEVKNLTIEYSTDDAMIHAVNDVSFSLSKGKTLGLVGETGAGKTTIAKSIMRILAPQAKKASGEILFEGSDLFSLSEKEMQKVRGNKIAMIFQDPMTALNPIERVGSQIAETIKRHNKISAKEAQERACDMLETVGIPMERYDEYPHEFSGGMKQRVVIAMALACNPALLLADEPTTALDVTIQAQVLEMMLNLKEKLNTSVIMITHDLGVAANFCNDVAVVYAGEIVERGSVEEIFDYPMHPYTVGLFNSLPRIDSKERRLKPIKGLMPDPSIVIPGCRFSERCPYATDKCKTAKPESVELRPGHMVKCFKAQEESKHE